MKETSPPELETIKTWLGSGSINVFGMPFAGKDTNAEKLAEVLDGEVIGGGDIIRNTPELAELNAKVSDGSLAPTDEYLRVVVPYFSQESFAGKPLILSSVGRWHGEEPGVVEAAKKSGHPLMAVLYITIGEGELRKRWEASQASKDRGERSDDAAEVIAKRIAEFKEKTLPVLDYYRDLGLLIEVNGEADRQTVLSDILGKLASWAAKS